MAKLAILLCTKNGSDYLFKQLLSIKRQSYKHFDIFIKDNHSSDNTSKIIIDFKKNNPQLNIYVMPGDNLHFANSFVSLAKVVYKKSVYDYFAFCDQDDEWYLDHLSRSLNFLKCKNQELALLCCSRTVLIDSNSNKIGMSKLFKKKPSFRNALGQSIAGANTMIFNKQACKNLVSVNLDYKIISHDWLLYILTSGAGGHIEYNIQPTVSYRQHKNNTIGSNNSLLAFLKRFSMIFSGEYQNYNIANVSLIKNLDFITDDNKKTLAFFSKSLQGRILKRFFNLYNSKVYRQSLIGNIALYLNAFINSKNKMDQ